MKRCILLMMLMASMWPCGAQALEKVYTPKQGAPERKAICDVMRKYVRSMHGMDRKKAFLWKIETLKVQGNYACFEAHAVNPDGSAFSDANSMIGDFQQLTFLRKNRDGWWVVADLTRTDVPSPEELKHIRGTFPGDVPTVLIPDYWRKKLR